MKNYLYILCFLFVTFNLFSEEKVSKYQKPFTAKVIRNKVRLRTQPNLYGAIAKEVDQGTLLLITGEYDDWYAVKPPQGMKTYIYRVYVLDGVVEGSRVNIRMEPDLESPVLTQLNRGDKVKGRILPQNHKWMEIEAPEKVRFYIAKEFVEKVGDDQYIEKIKQKQTKLSNILKEYRAKSKQELAKPFPKIELSHILNQLNAIIQESQHHPQEAYQAKQLIDEILAKYQEKKIHYLEKNANSNFKKIKEKEKALIKKASLHKKKIEELEKKLREQGIDTNAISSKRLNNVDTSLHQVTDKMKKWEAKEESLYQQWSKTYPEYTKDDYYEFQKQNGEIIRGIIKPYNRPIKNRPGDYILLSQHGNKPIAFLYSTIINLEPLVGKEVKMKVSSRDNNHFAFPAYFVLEIH